MKCSAATLNPDPGQEYLTVYRGGRPFRLPSRGCDVSVFLQKAVLKIKHLHAKKTRKFKKRHSLSG
jgi:hypothetical protein